MKKSKLKEYIREIILQEVSQEDVESAKELNKELEKTKELSDELGLTNETTEVNEAATDRFLKGAAYNLALQMRGKSASRTTLMNRLNRMPLANRLKQDELEKIIDYTMEEMGLNEAKKKTLKKN